MQDDFRPPSVPSDDASPNVPESTQPVAPTSPNLPALGSEPVDTAASPSPSSPTPTVISPTTPNTPSFSPATDTMPSPVSSSGTDTTTSTSTSPHPFTPPTTTPPAPSTFAGFSSVPTTSDGGLTPSPQVNGPTFGGQGGVPGSPMPPTPKPRKKLLLWSGISVAAIVLLAAVYVFAIYLPNTPSRVYSSSLSNTGLALDRIIDYSKQQEHATYSTMNFNGDIHYKSPSNSYDATLNGSIDKNANANIQLNTDAMGVKFATDILSTKAAGNTSPDIYVKLTGIKSVLDSLGLNSYDNLDGQWIVIDHTLVDTYESSSLGSSSNTSQSNTLPSYADVEDAIAKVQTVNKQYLFTKNSQNAVFVSQQFLGKSTSGGQTLDHYKVGYNKDHLNAYLTAVGQALDSSKLNSWYKGVNSGKNLSQWMNISSLQNRLKSANSNYTFDLWANTKTKLVAKITFADPSNKSTLYSVGQNYTGGTSYPLTFGFTGKNSNGDPEAANLQLNLDTSSNKVSLSYTDNTTGSDGISTTTATLSTTPSNTPVKVTAPTGAKSLTDILISLGLSSLADGSTQSTSNSTVNPFAITQSFQHACKSSTSLKQTAVCE